MNGFRKVRDFLLGRKSSPPQFGVVLGGGGAQAQPAGPSALTGMLASPLAKAALAGIAAMVVKRVMQGSAR